MTVLLDDRTTGTDRRPVLPAPARPLVVPDPGAVRHRPAPGRRCARDRAAERHARQRRRRLVLSVVAGGLLVALALPWGGTGGRPLTPSGPALAGDRVVPGAVYVVQPGDTLWSIAERLDPSGDPRPTVDRLAAETGSDTVTVGEVVHLP